MMNYSNKNILTLDEIVCEWAKDNGALKETLIKQKLWIDYFNGKFTKNGKSQVFILLPGSERAKRLRSGWLLDFLKVAGAVIFKKKRPNTTDNITEINFDVLTGDYKFIESAYINQARISRDTLNQYCKEGNFPLPTSIFPPIENKPHKARRAIGKAKITCKVPPLDPQNILKNNNKVSLSVDITPEITAQVMSENGKRMAEKRPSLKRSRAIRQEGLDYFDQNRTKWKSKTEAADEIYELLDVEHRTVINWLYKFRKGQ